MAKVRPLLADAHTVNTRPHRAMVARTAVDIEGTGVPDRAIRVERIPVGLPIVSIPRKQPPGANPKHVAPGLDAFAAWRAIGAVCASHGLGTHESEDQSHGWNIASHGDFQASARLDEVGAIARAGHTFTPIPQFPSGLRQAAIILRGARR
jgi:hypothetical protein